MKKLITALVLATTFSSHVLAATQTVVLSIPGMNCAACPFTMKMALNKIEGVDKVDVSYEKKEAVVTYEDTQTGTQAFKEVLADLGYPAEQQK
jgi:mercuric ion binding protein